MPNRFTDLNIEQNFSRYLADKFQEKEYAVYWWNTKQTESYGDEENTITIIRDFPEDPVYFVKPTEPQQDHLVKVPALSVMVETSAKTADEFRMGIGESCFEWRAEVRIEMFASTELEWYKFSSWLKEWLSHPDIRIDVRDFEGDLSDELPELELEKIMLENSDVRRQELAGKGFPEAARYFIQYASTAKFIE